MNHPKEMKLYILDENRQAISVEFNEWAKEFKTSARQVAVTTFVDCKVSTVFLGVDHNYFDVGPPLLFETLVFDGVLDDEMRRCSTWEEAEIQHAEVVQEVKNAR